MTSKKSIRHILWIATVIAILLFAQPVAHCDDLLRVTATKTTLLKGETAQLTGTAVFPDGSLHDFTSSKPATVLCVEDPTQATVTSEGLVTALSQGQASILVTNENPDDSLQTEIIFTISEPNVVSGAGLDPSCVVSVLNRNARVNSDGTWLLPNIPANFGLVRARATCASNGITQFGQSAFFTIPANGSTNVPRINIGVTTPIPNALNLTAGVTQLSAAGAVTQLTATASYADGTQQDITSAAKGTLYNVSNPAIVTVSPNGVVTAVSSGTAVIQAVNEGTAGIANIQVVLAGASHGGIPDSWAIEHGLDPNDPAMPFEDPDH